MSRSTAAAILILSVLLNVPALRAEPQHAAAEPGSPRAESASAPSGESHEALREQVRRAETAFAKSMADRDHAAFTSFLADEAIFVGPRRVLRGKQAVADGWKPLYEGPRAPFSWKPETVEVVESGTLALSSGPVMDETGKRTGTFNSTWRREPDGRWKIVLDIGCPACEPPPTAEPKKK